MLVLTRKPDQSLRIRDDIVVKVLAVRGNRVRLGIEAPVATSIHRAEVSVALLEESCSSSGVIACPVI